MNNTVKLKKKRGLGARITKLTEFSKPFLSVYYLSGICVPIFIAFRSKVPESS